MIWGISGKLGVGKDWVGDGMMRYLRDNGGNPMKICFADAIKIELAVKECYNMRELFGDKSSDIRRKLQTIGTERGRLVYGDDIWIRHVKAWCEMYEMRGVTDFVITDVRFKNEAEWIRESGGKLIRIVSESKNHRRLMKESSGSEDKYNEIKNHISETDLDLYEFDQIIHNDDLTFDKLGILTGLKI